VKDFNIIKLKSDAFYGAIVKYIVDQDLMAEEVYNLDKQDQSYFFLALFVLNGNLNNDKFFEQMKEVVQLNLKMYSK
jgi:hypothetical protein